MSSSPVNTPQQSLLSTETDQAGSFIDRQLHRATTQVKLIDLAGALLTWAAATIGLLLTLAVFDAWVFTLPVALRLAAFTLLSVGSVAYLAIYLWPLLTRRINPMYAARMVEQDHPTLKNSLINFLSFRQAPQTARRKVLEAMTSRAAMDLSQLSIESAIDHGKLIRIGYVLIALLVIGSGYKILSPKDPFTTLTRIASPLADVPPPARVQISNVEPGDHECSFGEPLLVSAEIEGLTADQVAYVWVTTDDQTWVDHQLPMTPTDSPKVHELLLRTAETGVEHSLTYRIHAGDAWSKNYRVTLRQKPTASLERLELIPPKYTDLPTRELVSQGDVEGLEGTIVRVHGKANVPLEAAVLELLRPEQTAAGSDWNNARASKRIKMRLEDQNFTGEFRLELKPDRTTPAFSHYRIALLTKSQQVNESPAHYRINVLPDMAPEVEWIKPTETEIEVPINGEVMLETRAIDRDFQISRVVLRADQQGSQKLVEDLLDASRTADDQHLGKYRFRPADLELAPGDSVVLHLQAFDNRCHPESGIPDPNVTRSANLTIRISPTDPDATPDRTGNGSANTQPNQNQPANDDTQNNDANQSGSSNDQDQNSEQAEGSNAENNTGSGSGSSSSQQDESSGSESTEQNTGSGSGTSTGDSNQSQSSSNQSSGSGQGNSAADPSQSSESSQQSDSSQQDATATDSTESGTTNSGNSTDNTGATRPADQQTDPNQANPEDATQGNSGQSGGSKPPQHEGEVFEKILERLKNEAGESSAGDNSEEGNAEDGNPEDGNPASDQQSQTGDQQTDPANNAGSGDPSQREGTNPQDGQQADNNQPSNNSSSGSGDETNQDQASGDSASGQSNPNNSAQNNTDQNSSNQSQRGNGSQQTDQQSSNTQPQSSDSNTGTPSNTTDENDPNQNSASQTNDSQSGSDNSQAGNESNGSQSDSQSGSGDTASDNASSDSTGTDPSQSGQGDSEQGNSGQAGDADSQPPSRSDNSSDSGNSTSGNSAGADDQAANEQTNSADNEGSSGSSDSQQNSSATADGQPSRNGSQDKSDPGNRARPGSANQSGSNNSSPSDEDLPEGEKAKLEYTREATDLVLDYLKRQEQKPDAELLRELNWTEEDLRRFLQRWEQMKQAAETGDAQQKQQFQRRLRSLGLMPPSGGVQGVETTQDQFNGLQQDGLRSEPPAEFAEKFRRFLRGTARRESDQPAGRE